MNANPQDRLKELLQQSLPPVEESQEPGRDLWPAVQQRLRQPHFKPAPHLGWVLFDSALLAGLVAFAAFIPASIPVFLYYL